MGWYVICGLRRHMNPFVAFIGLLVIFGTASSPAWAGFSERTSHGPDRGPVRALSIDPQNPKTLYAATQEGFFKTVDGGMTWVDSNVPTTSGGPLLVDSQKP